jgi:archaellum biogenesis ATPase FlaH
MPISLPEVLTLKAIAGDATVSVADTLDRLDRWGVSESDFAETPTRALFAGMAATLRNGRPLELVSLLAAVGSRAPRDLVLDVLTNWELGVSEPRLAALREAGRRRSLEAALRGLLGLVGSDADYAAVHGETLKTLAALDVPTAELRTLDGELMGLVDEVHAVYEGRAESTLRTGIEALDEAIGGLQPTLTILGAEPGAGKSALMARIVRNVAERGVKVGVFSLEDQSRWMVRRMVAESALLPVFVLQNRPLEKHQFERFGTAAVDVHRIARNIVVEDRKGLMAKDIVATARVMVARHGVKAIFVDHLGEVRVNRTERHDRDIGDVLRELRAIADAHRVPVVVLCHVKRRDGVGEEPRLTDFAFSADVERTARVALALVKPAEDRQGIHILKQTSGKKDIAVWLRFNGPAAMSTNEEINQ